MNGPSFAEVFGISLATLFLFGFAWRWGLFSFPERNAPWNPSLRFSHLATAFALYLGIFCFALFFLTQPLLKKFSGLGEIGQIQAISVLHFIIYLTVLGTLGLFLREQIRTIWRDPTEKKHLLQDLMQALGYWVVAFPLAAALQGIIYLILVHLFHIVEFPDQNSIYMVKMTLGDPLYFLFTLITIVLFGPIAEELLFRGFLQSYLRQWIGKNSAIVLTALIFASFHFSMVQEISNISILPALFVFALFLGALYEKQRSLFAPIALHAFFNGFNALQLYLGIAT